MNTQYQLSIESVERTGKGKSKVLRLTKSTCSVYIPISGDSTKSAIRALEKALGF